MPHLFQNRTSLAHTGGRDPKLQHGGCGGTGWGRRMGARAGTWLPSHGGPGAVGRRPPHTSGLAGRRAAHRAPPRALQVGWPQARRGGTGTAAPQGPRPRVWSLADTRPVPAGRAPPGAAFTPEEPPPPPRPLERSFAKIQDEENGQTGSFCPRARGTGRPPTRPSPSPAAPVLRVLASLQRSKRHGGTASAPTHTRDSVGTRGGAEARPCCAKLRSAVNA